MDKIWQGRGRDILKTATRAAKKGEAEAGDWLAGSSLEVRTVAQMAGISEYGLVRLVESIRATRRTDHLDSFLEFGDRSWRRLASSSHRGRHDFR